MRDSLLLVRTMPRSPVVGYALMTMTPLAALCGDPEQAALFYGAIRSDEARLTSMLGTAQLDAHVAVLDRLKGVLGARFESAATAGSAQSWDAALEAALAWVDARLRTDIGGASAEPAPDREDAVALDSLTPREREVLALLARGMSNAEIGASLGVSPKTVMHHTVAIYRKLGVRGRAEAAVRAVHAGIARNGTTSVWSVHG
jgi:DNA-binding CsgD family transcriptional regulator